jgi:hypothetical protein
LVNGERCDEHLKEQWGGEEEKREGEGWLYRKLVVCLRIWKFWDSNNYIGAVTSHRDALSFKILVWFLRQFSQLPASTIGYTTVSQQQCTRDLSISTAVTADE